MKEWLRRIPQIKPIAILVIAALAALLSGCSNPNTPSTSESRTLTYSAPETSQPTSTSAESAWKELYTTELEKHIGSFSPKFNICDLDGDGTPELLISDDDIHADGGEIYTVYNGKLYDLGGYGSWGEFQYDLVNDYIVAGHTGQGETYISVYRLKNDKMIEIISFHDNMGSVADESQWVFEVNGKSVTQEEYQTECDKYLSGNYASPFVRKFDVTESEISRVIGEYPSITARST